MSSPTIAPANTATLRALLNTAADRVYDHQAAARKEALAACDRFNTNFRRTTRPGSMEPSGFTGDSFYAYLYDLATTLHAPQQAAELVHAAIEALGSDLPSVYPDRADVSRRRVAHWLSNTATSVDVTELLRGAARIA